MLPVESVIDEANAGSGAAHWGPVPGEAKNRRDCVYQSGHGTTTSGSGHTANYAYELGGTGVEYWGSNFSGTTVNSYPSEPKLTVNHDGTMITFISDWCEFPYSGASVCANERAASPILYEFVV